MRVLSIALDIQSFRRLFQKTFIWRCQVGAGHTVTEWRREVQVAEIALKIIASRRHSKARRLNEITQVRCVKTKEKRLQH